MYRLISKSRLAVILIAAFILVDFGLPSKAQAQWHRSGEIEKGLISTETLIIVGVVTIGGILLISQISKAKKKSKEKEYWENEKSDSISTDTTSFDTQGWNSETEMVQEQLRKTKAHAPLNLYLSMSNYGVKGMDFREKYFRLTNKTVAVGLSLSL